MLEQTNRDDGVIVLTLNTPKTNAIDLDMLREIGEVVTEVNRSDALKGIVLTGTDTFFSSGFDLPTFINFKDRAEAETFFEVAEETLLDFFTCEKPVVSAINGHCAAAGLIFSMAADYRIAADTRLRMGMSEIKIGLPLSIAQALIMQFGLDSEKKYRDVMFFGEMMRLEKASEMGLVDKVVPPESLVDEAASIVTAWIDTPNRPFIQMKRIWKHATATAIRNALATQPWQDGLSCFFEEDVRATLMFVQEAMNSIKTA